MVYVALQVLLCPVLKSITSKLQKIDAEMKNQAATIIANYWINRPPILVRSVPVIPVPNVPPKLKKDSKLAKSIC